MPPTSQTTQCPVCRTNQHDRLLYPATFSTHDFNPHVFSARRVPDRVYYRMVECRRCGILRGTDVVTAEELAMLYQHSGMNDGAIAEAAARTYGYYVKKYLPGLALKTKFLEVGSGAGYFLQWLIANGFTDVHGIEPSQQAIDAAGAAKPFIRRGMFDSSVVTDNAVDVICAFHVFDHLPDPTGFLRTARGLLNPGGTLMLVMHDIGFPLARILGERCPMIDIEHPFLYTKQALKQLLQAEGFQVIKQFDVINTYPLGYWAQLAPIPNTVKTWIKTHALGQMLLSMALGNQGVIAVKQ